MLINRFKLIANKLWQLKHKATLLAWSLLGVTVSARADDDPFPSLKTTGDVITTAGTHMESALKYGLIGGGGLLIIICLAIIIHRMREDSKEKDHGNMVTTFILLALGLTLGFVLIGVGWTAFEYNPQS